MCLFTSDEGSLDMGEVPSDDEVSLGSSDDDQDQENIADLAGYPPEEQHRPGMIALLNQMFRNNAINVSTIADLAIEKKLGTVIIMQDEDNEDEPEDSSGVFVVTAAIDFRLHQKSAAVTELRSFLLKQIHEHGTSDDISFAENQLKADSPSNSIFIVNEKMVNLPGDFTLVPLQSLDDEIKTMVTDESEADPAVICILKLYKKATEESLCYVHPEEKVICDLADRFIDYPVSVEEFGAIFLEGETDDEPSEDCPPFRRICFMSAKVFQNTCLNALKTKVEELRQVNLYPEV